MKKEETKTPAKKTTAAKTPAKKTAAKETAVKKTAAAKTTAAPAKEKKVKEEKKLPASKLPKIFKKSYTEKKLEKLLNKIYVPPQREEIKDLFVSNPDKPGEYYIPLNQEFPKSKLEKYQRIGKDVASQKFSIKIVPLVATIAICAAIVIVVGIFKNPIAKKALVSVMQNTFGAKTEVNYVNVEIFGAKVEVDGLKQGYADDPMKNLFELDKVIIDFNLTELLRGKFDLQNIAVEGVDVMTARETSAELPKKVKVKSEKKNSFQLALDNKVEVAKTAASDELTKLFEQYNPENILKNLESQLSSPAVAEEVYSLGDELVNKWKDKPVEITNRVEKFSKDAEEITKTDWSKITDPVKIADATKKITSLLSESKSLINDSKALVSDVKGDAAQIKTASEKIKTAIKHDTDFVNTELNKIKSFTIKDGVNLISGPIDTIMYKTIGKYYPYLKQGINLALQSKNSSSEKKEKAEKPDPARKRLAGRYVWYKQDRVPKFLIENLSCSGVNWNGSATNISSDMDKRGEPAIANAKMNISGQNHSGVITVDTRTVTDNPLVNAIYSGDNYPIEFSGDQFGLKSKSVINGRMNVKDDGSFTIGGDLLLKSLQFETPKFEPEFAYNLYAKSLSYLKEMKVGIDMTFTDEENFDLKITTDADKQFADVLKKLFNDEINSVKNQAKSEITKLLNEKTGGATSKLNEFIDIENGINASSLKMDKLNSQLEAKKKELLAKGTDEAKSKATEAIGDALKGMKLPF